MLVEPRISRRTVQKEKKKMKLRASIGEKRGDKGRDTECHSVPHMTKRGCSWISLGEGEEGKERNTIFRGGERDV